MTDLCFIIRFKETVRCKEAHWSAFLLIGLLISTAAEICQRYDAALLNNYHFGRNERPKLVILEIRGAEVSVLRNDMRRGVEGATEERGIPDLLSRNSNRMEK